MAEVGLVASIVQLAGFGIKLSISLYAFAESVSSADKDIKHVAKDVSLTSAVLNQLGENLKDDKQNGIASDNAIKTADEVVHECSEVFREIDIALEKGTGKGTAMRSLGRLKWPFLQPKMELLRSNLERLKSTLILMLHVLTYATKRKQHTVNASQTDFERQQIQHLIIANQRAVAGFERLSLTSGAPSEHATDEFSQNSYPMPSTLRTLGKEQTDTRANDDPTISLMARPNLMPLPPGQDEHPSKETTDSAFSAAQDSPAATFPQGHIQMMSSMHAKALFQWLQKAGAIVEDTWSARTMLTATSILPATSDLPKKQQAPIENAKNVFGFNSEPMASDFAFRSPENQDVLDSFDFDSFLQSNDEFNDFNPTRFPLDGAEMIPGSKVQSTTDTSKEEMPPVTKYKDIPPDTSDKDKTHKELNEGFDADRIPTDDHPPDELSKDSGLDPPRTPIQKPSQRTKQPIPGSSAADLQGHQERMKAAQEASMKKASIAGPSSPTPVQAQHPGHLPPSAWPHGAPISPGTPQLTHGQFRLPSQKKKKNDPSCAVSAKGSGLESRLQRSKELRLEAEEEARKIYEEQLEALNKLEDEVRNVLVLQEETKMKEEADEDLHKRMKATLDEAGFSAESVARLLKGTEQQSRKEEKTVEQIYFEVNALKEGRMDGIRYPERIGEIDLNRPTWIKVHRNHLSPDTLDLYELPWEWDERDPAYILIKRWIPESDQDILFEHTRQMREARALPEESQRTEPYTRMSQSPGPHLRRGRDRGSDDESGGMLSYTSEEESITPRPPAETSKEDEKFARLEKILTPSKDDLAKATGQELDKQEQQLQLNEENTNVDYKTATEQIRLAEQRARLAEEKTKCKPEPEGVQTFNSDSLFGCSQPNINNTDDPFKFPASSTSELGQKGIKRKLSDDILKPDSSTTNPVILGTSDKSPTQTPANIHSENDAKRIGRRKGPLREEQKAQAALIREHADRAESEGTPASDLTQEKPKEFISCDKLWDRWQSSEKVHSNEIDMDDLCTQLRSKAKCSGHGAVIDQADIDRILGPSIQDQKGVAKQSIPLNIGLDTNLDDMEGIIDPNSPGRTTPGGTTSKPYSIDPSAWDAPDSWAVKKTDEPKTRDALSGAKEEAEEKAEEEPEEDTTQRPQEGDNEGNHDEVDELLGRWTTL